MGRPEIVPFSDEHLDEAARLLAARHARHRAVEPLLPGQFEDPAVARAEIEAAWREEGATGACAVRDRRLVGFLIGAPGDDSVWGANVWVGLAGQATEEPEAVRDLYSALAADWVESERGRHYVVVPAFDGALLEAWFRLSFGQQQAYAIREVPADPWPDGVREAEARDVGALLQLAPLINRHQVLSPVFSGKPWSYGEDEARADIENDIASADIGALVAEVDGHLVGYFVVARAELSGMHTSLARPEHASYLAWAATLPESRGSGAGLALTSASFAWAHAAGYPTMVTDWRVTNLLSSRFWPKRGFRTSFLRLYRSIP